MVKKLLTIAGSDTWGGGGISTDLKTFENFQVFGLSVITSIAVKKDESFQLVSLPTQLVKEQLATIEDVFPLNGVKIGYLGNIEIISLVHDFLKKHQGEFPVVLDPVLAFKETTSQSSKDYLKALEGLIPLANLMTPNFEEGKLLLGNEKSTSIEELGQGLFTKYHVPVFLKGGKRLDTKKATDILITKEEQLLLESSFSKKNTTNGAGCSLSSAFASTLALDFPIAKSAQITKNYVREAIEQGIEILDAGDVWHQGKEATLNEK